MCVYELKDTALDPYQVNQSKAENYGNMLTKDDNLFVIWVLMEEIH